MSILGKRSLIAAFVVVTLLAMEPLQGLDRVANHKWLRGLGHDTVWIFNNVLDRIASHAVNLPVMVVVSLWVMWRARSIRPGLVAVLAEGGFYLTGVVKMIFARPAPDLRDPQFFSGGLWSDGRLGVSFPSGHAVEAVLIYGSLVYIIGTYAGVTPRVMRWVHVAWAVVIVNCVVTSFLLGYHWITDLAGGLVFGALLLRLIVDADLGRRPFDRLPVPNWLAWPSPTHRAPRATGPATLPRQSSAPATTPRSSAQESSRR